MSHIIPRKNDIAPKFFLLVNLNLKTYYSFFFPSSFAFLFFQRKQMVSHLVSEGSCRPLLVPCRGSTSGELRGEGIGSVDKPESSDESNTSE